MAKKIIFNVLLNLIIIFSVLFSAYFFKKGNYLMPIVGIAAFGLTIFYKLKLMKQVRAEMQSKTTDKKA
jgi:hypothetical protein